MFTGASSRLGIFGRPRRRSRGPGREDGYLEVPNEVPIDETRLLSDTPFLSDLADFAVDGASMLIRSVLLQGSFFAAMVCASRRLGATGLAAHHVVTQLWMCSAYLVDGVATAGTVSGSRLVGAAMVGYHEGPGRAGRRDGRTGDDDADERGFHVGDTRADELEARSDVSFEDVLASLRSVCARLLLLALIAGVAICLGFVRFRATLVRGFTSDESVASALLDEKLWTLLAFSQPLNAAVFCLDGLVYAFQDFGFVREAFEVGVGYVFAPTLAWAYGKTPATLAAVWTAKVALNAWRLVVVGARIVGWCLTRRGLRGACERRRGGGRTEGGRGAESRIGGESPGERRGRGRDGGGEPDRRRGRRSAEVADDSPRADGEI